MNELKSSEYNDIKSAVIASRDNLCNNPTLMNKSNVDKTYKCRSLRKNDECSYFLNLKNHFNEPDLNQPILDIEDLDRVGQKFQCCSFYASKNLIKPAEIIFMPYNYLLDPKIRKLNPVELKGAIIILDEAHNVEKMCEDSACTSIKSFDICTAIGDLKHVIKLFVSCE